MKLLVTGASGFLGRYVVARALSGGHRVRAVLGPRSEEGALDWRHHPGVELRRLDLRNSDGIADALKEVEAVVHLAVAKEAALDAQLAGTVRATGNLLDAMAQERVTRLVVTSSFSVFDYLNIPEGSIVNEDSLVDSEPEHRDAYTRAKILQERIAREYHELRGGAVTILRPGAIYGRNNLWTARLGFKLSERLWIRIGSKAQLPLTYVENCAEAIVAAAERDAAIGATLNIVDDELPTQSEYVRALRDRLEKTAWVLPVSWTLMRLVAVTVWTCNRLMRRRRLDLPGILVPKRLHARFKPLRYENRRARETLQWKPRFGMRDALDRSCSTLDLLSVPRDSVGTRTDESPCG